MIQKQDLAEIDLAIKDVEKILSQMKALRNKTFAALVAERAKVENDEAKK